MNHLPLIIKREYLTKVKNKAFVVMTFLSPIIVITLISVVAYLSQLNNDKIRTITILDESGFLHDVFENSEHTTYNILEGISLEDAILLTKETSTYGLLYISKLEDIDAVSNHIKFYSEESPSLSIISSIESKLESKLTNIKLQK